METLPETGCATGLSEPGRRFLTSFGEFRQYESGLEIMKTGQAHPYLYLILDGSVDVFYRGFKDEIRVGSIGVGGSFGEFAVLFDHPPAATIRTTAPKQVWRIEAEAFKQFTQESPGAANRVLIELLHVMGQRLRNAGQMVVGNTILNKEKEA